VCMRVIKSFAHSKGRWWPPLQLMHTVVILCMVMGADGHQMPVRQGEGRQ